MKEKYSLDNKSLNLNRVKYTHEKNCKFPVEKRIEVITKQLALGNMRLVADLTGVSYGLIRIWKTQPWWKEMELEIRNSRKARVDDKRELASRLHELDKEAAKRRAAMDKAMRKHGTTVEKANKQLTAAAKELRQGPPLASEVDLGAMTMARQLECVLRGYVMADEGQADLAREGTDHHQAALGGAQSRHGCLEDGGRGHGVHHR